MIFVGLAGMASFKDMAPLKNPFKYMDGIPEYSCYGARLGCPIKAGSMQGCSPKEIPSSYNHANFYADPNQLTNLEGCSI